MGNLPAALADLDHAITLDPRFTLAYQERSAVHQKMNRPDLASADLLKISELSKPPGK
jgi:Tfp pilus assembly protein PilF